MILRNFVVLEGGDGSGTSTQLDILKENFKREFPDLSVHFTFEPTDGPMGSLVRGALRDDPPLFRDTVARLFAADRGEHLYGPGGLVERCRAGQIVVCDRYVLSSLVYQGLLCGDEFPRRLNEEFPYPEFLLFFDIKPEAAAERYGKRALRDNYEHLDFQRQVHDRYEALLPAYLEGGSRFVRIDAAATIEKVAEQVWSALQELPILKG